MTTSGISRSQRQRKATQKFSPASAVPRGAFHLLFYEETESLNIVERKYIKKVNGGVAVVVKNGITTKGSIKCSGTVYLYYESHLLLSPSLIGTYKQCEAEQKTLARILSQEQASEVESEGIPFLFHLMRLLI